MSAAVIQERAEAIADAVHPLPSQRVLAAVGSEVLAGDRYLDPGNLLMFLDQGAVVREVSAIPDLLVTRQVDGYAADTELVPHGSGTPTLLLLGDA